MSNKAHAVISTLLTIIFLVILAIASVLLEMLALNGASERQGTLAMGISLACQGVSLVLIAVFTRWFTNLLIARFNWSKVVAVIVAVISGVLLGSVISFLSLIISIPVAGIR